MILLLGATGYIGQAFADELRRRRLLFIPLTRKAIDYSCFEVLFDYVRRAPPRFVINAAGFAGSINPDESRSARAEAVQANIVLPQTVARVCAMTNTPWGHVSSGSIYSGARINDPGGSRVEKNLSSVLRLFEEHPDRLCGFTETDEPNCSFRNPPCSFYSGAKALAEEVLSESGRGYIWRPNIAFDEVEHSRNFLSELQRHSTLRDGVSSLSHRGDFVRACLDLWERGAAFGIYNIVNPGPVTTRRMVETLQRILKIDRRFGFASGDSGSGSASVLAPGAGCLLNPSKLMDCGIEMRPAAEALEDAVMNWRTTASAFELFARRGRMEDVRAGDDHHASLHASSDSGQKPSMKNRIEAP